MNNTYEISKLIRKIIIEMTTNAGSGHPTSALSAVELVTVLFNEGYFKYNIKNPNNLHNDKLIFSKGHATPLFYTLWALSGGFSLGELENYRKIDSNLEGHPSVNFPFTIAPTGSLGQGLSIGAGLAYSAKKYNKSDHKTYVLLGDGELAEGQIWEAIDFASYNKLDNLVAIVDVNRLEQVGETMYGWDIERIENMLKIRGWSTYLIHDGNDINQVKNAYEWLKYDESISSKPKAIIAKTVKGKGISFLENSENWHGKALNKDQLNAGLKEIGEVDESLRIKLEEPNENYNVTKNRDKLITDVSYEKEKPIAPRDSYGDGLVNLGKNIVVIDSGVSNSTKSEKYKEKFEDNFIETYIAEQNSIGIAIGTNKAGIKTYYSTFGAFLTRAYDQIRMATYSDVDIVICGSHAGVSIGEDGFSQMALEDISMFRTLQNTTVLYPSDAVSMTKAVENAYMNNGITYIRSTRNALPVIYESNDVFSIGKSKTLKEHRKDKVAIISAGITTHEALKAYDELQKIKIHARIIDIYSIKPIDQEAIKKAAKDTKFIVTVEDHSMIGGLGDAVLEVLNDSDRKVYKMGINKIPKSGTTEELLDYEGISANHIVDLIKSKI